MPTGQAGATILDSYESYEEFIRAHPTGTPGDAYLVDGVLYVWNAETEDWQPMGSLIGPTGDTGPTGQAGAVILDSYAEYDDFIEDHPTGTAGDAYLVEGDLYVWSAEDDDWLNMGSLIGPTGDTGPTGQAGAVILGSYDTFANFIAEHPTGTAGDAYLVGGNLYVWSAEEEDWVNMGSLVGPTGNVGTILGSYDTLAALIADHPDGGNQGDSYLVDGRLYVWDTEAGEWRDVGNLRGPAGAAGESRTIIPFASTIAPYTYAENHLPTAVSLLGFGYGDNRLTTPTAIYAIDIDPNDGGFRLNGANYENHQLAFSMPFDMVLRSIYTTVGTFGEWTFQGSVYPYIQLYSAPAGTNTFTPIPGAIAIPEVAIGPGTVPRDTMRAAFANDINVRLPAGTRVAIGALMRIDDDAAAREYWLYFTGGVGFVNDAEG